MISKTPAFKATGKPRIYSVPAHLDPKVKENWTLKFGGKNMVCVGMHDTVQRLLMRDFELWQPARIALGYGGEYTQTGSYTALRQAPAYYDTAMRKTIMTTPLVQITQSGMTEERRIHYSSILDPIEGVTSSDNPDRPFIDELGIEAANGTLLAHYVSDADSSGRTLKQVKTNLEWLVIDWEIQFVATPEV
jgi:hypothetical protein